MEGRNKTFKSLEGWKKNLLKGILLLPVLAIVLMLAHELGHVLAIYLMGAKFVGLSLTLEKFVALGVYKNDGQRAIVYVAGSVTSLLASLIIFLVTRKKKSFPACFASGNYFVGESFYDALSIMIKEINGDFYTLLAIAPSVNAFNLFLFFLVLSISSFALLIKFSIQIIDNNQIIKRKM
jgi:hypothetical protein